MDPSIPPFDCTCHSFRLPAELQNKVYDFVLHDPQGLLCVRQRTATRFVTRLLSQCKVEDGSNPDQKADQLKYVNHSIHQEVRGLVLKNNMIFEDGVSSVPIFLAELPPSLRNLPYTITIIQHPFIYQELDVMTSKPWRIISDFCAANPAMTVVVHMPKKFLWDLRLYEILGLMSLLREHNPYYDRALSALPWQERGLLDLQLSSTLATQPNSKSKPLSFHHPLTHFPTSSPSTLNFPSLYSQ
ncbi:hypothetical protein ACN47E_003982 [Coniothyrium glycines]